ADSGQTDGGNGVEETVVIDGHGAVASAPGGRREVDIDGASLPIGQARWAVVGLAEIAAGLDVLDGQRTQRAQRDHLRVAGAAYRREWESETGWIHTQGRKGGNAPDAEVILIRDQVVPRYGLLEDSCRIVELGAGGGYAVAIKASALRNARDGGHKSTSAHPPH